MKALLKTTVYDRIVKDLMRASYAGRSLSYRAIASETFRGVPLYVVPEGYCPV